MGKLSAQSKLLLCLVTWHEVWTPSDPSLPHSLTTVRHLKVMLGVLLLLPRLISDTCQTCSDVKIFCSHLVLWRWGLQIWSLSRVPWRLPIASRVETLRLPHSEIMDDYGMWQLMWYDVIRSSLLLECNFGHSFSLLLESPLPLVHLGYKKLSFTWSNNLHKKTLMGYGETKVVSLVPIKPWYLTSRQPQTLHGGMATE